MTELHGASGVIGPPRVANRRLCLIIHSKTGSCTRIADPQFFKLSSKPALGDEHGDTRPTMTMYEALSYQGVQGLMICASPPLGTIVRVQGGGRYLECQLSRDMPGDGSRVRLGIDKPCSISMINTISQPRAGLTRVTPPTEPTKY